MLEAILQLSEPISRFGIPIMIVLLLVALGGMFSERSGVVNIALEGIMVMGAFVAAVVIYFMTITNDAPLQLAVLVGLIAGAITGMVFAVAHAFASVTMNSNQIISATALNIFAPAISVFVARTFYVNPVTRQATDRINISASYRFNVPVLENLPIIGEFLFTRAFLSTFIGFAVLIIVIIVFSKTRLGLRIKSCGENPHAAESLGINVYKVRYTGVMISGLLAGLGGASYMISFHNGFDGHVHGLGFLALAMLISGQWKPFRVFIFAIIFSFFYIVQAQYDSLLIFQNVDLPRQIYQMVPYVMTLFILAYFSKSAQAPQALGEPYDASKR